jgi:hypothetical protein
MIGSFSQTRYYRISSLKEIFNQDSSGNATIKSLYYQHIIRNFLKDTDSYFKVRQISNTIFNIVPLRRKKNFNPNNNKSEMVEDREKTIRKYCKQLVSWQILSKRQTNVEKGPVLHLNIN